MAIKLAYSSYQIGDWIIDCNDLSLTNGELKEYLPAKAFDVLKLLLLNGDQTVTKREFIDARWQGNTDVGLAAINGSCRTVVTNQHFCSRLAIDAQAWMPRSDHGTATLPTWMCRVLSFCLEQKN